MIIKPSYFDYGVEIDVCSTYQIENKAARLSMRRVGEKYELYARTYFPAAETVIVRGGLEHVVNGANALMQEHFGPDWEGDTVMPDEVP